MKLTHQIHISIHVIAADALLPTSPRLLVTLSVKFSLTVPVTLYYCITQLAISQNLLISEIGMSNSLLCTPIKLHILDM
jgi:hypothetical protein